MIQIDGSYGEGGGQILRTSLALSIVCRQPVEIINIRRARSKPGLQPQHLTSVKAAVKISNADVRGAELSSTKLAFSPGEIRSGEHSFDVSEIKGSAGSTSLVLQTILLPLLLADRPSTAALAGGTHVPWSPVFNYLKSVFLPFLSKMNISVEINIEKWGWYPQGGGVIRAAITPRRSFLPVVLKDRGDLKRVRGVSAVSNLPIDIAVRQRTQAIKRLSQKGIDAEIEIVNAPSPGRGTLLFLIAEFDNIAAGFGSLGALGKRAETVADEAVKELLGHLASEGTLDPNLADQVIPYLAFAAGKSEFTTSRITQHLLTNIWVVRQFRNVEISVEGREGEPGAITVQQK